MTDTALQNDALTHLKSLTLLWLNLDQSSVRRDSMIKHVLPLFGREERVPAVDGKSVTDQDAMLFVAAWVELYRQHHGRLTIANQPPGVNFRSATQKANVAIKRSHLAALAMGLQLGDERFAIGEDDIMPRSTLMDGLVPLPPEEADVAIWSGGLPMAGVSADDALFQQGRKHVWAQVHSKACFNCLGAGLYVVNRHAAETLHDWVSRRPMSYDHAWGFAFTRLKVYRLVPNAFAQAGPSIRNTANRKPVLKRKEK